MYERRPSPQTMEKSREPAVEVDEQKKKKNIHGAYKGVL